MPRPPSGIRNPSPRILCSLCWKWPYPNSETPPGVWKRRMWTPPGKYACATKTGQSPSQSAGPSGLPRTGGLLFPQRQPSLHYPFSGTDRRHCQNHRRHRRLPEGSHGHPPRKRKIKQFLPVRRFPVAHTKIMMNSMIRISCVRGFPHKS